MYEQLLYMIISFCRILNLPGMDKPAAKSTAEREQIRHELEMLNEHIENLEISEDERLARELQSIELNIQETQRQLKSVCTFYYHQIYV